ncbi:hypothetical protein F5878DRAFT_645827 [Lentinula raphanica]|uniref:Secreted protein n=1 Tax=Lentinula raphanica TaxID=153919 RepID=A0AA38U8I9_9AGAR|nr:hypothetical protein EV360DRAFT_70631 [Lentinula raphanica]KAJ3833580.1 hypothetical protein F5878DRAFT_645827 [Lentinula raphanica]
MHFSTMFVVSAIAASAVCALPLQGVCPSTCPDVLADQPGLDGSSIRLSAKPSLSPRGQYIPLGEGTNDQRPSTDEGSQSSQSRQKGGYLDGLKEYIQSQQGRSGSVSQTHAGSQQRQPGRQESYFGSVDRYVESQRGPPGDGSRTYVTGPGQRSSLQSSTYESQAGSSSQGTTHGQS